ncbi:hypothetical protein ACFVIM_05580 [Streptomyces sp. NPDC057638]|uniref:hypothetical protein n=1 Tax=Streptomyces sp. NPDC057638 TaxID=3346190 RepID=UPI0036804D35
MVMPLALFTGALALYLPGLLILRGYARTSWWTGLTMAPPLSAGLLVLSGGSVAGWAAGVIALAAGLWVWRTDRAPSEQRAPVAVATAAVILGALWLRWPQGPAGMPDGFAPFTGLMDRQGAALVLLLTAVVTPAGMAGLARMALPRLPFAAPVAAGLVVLAPPPPYALELALVPAAVALVLRTQRQGWPPLAWAVVALAAVGLAGTRPWAAAGAAALACAAVAETLLRRRHRDLPRVREAARALGCGTLALVVALPWPHAPAPPAGSPLGLGDALLSVVLLDPHPSQPFVLGPALMTALGWAALLWLALRSRIRWPLVTAVGCAVLAAPAATGALALSAPGLLALLSLPLTLAVAAAIALATRRLAAPTLRPRPALAAVAILLWSASAALLGYVPEGSRAESSVAQVRCC